MTWTSKRSSEERREALHAVAASLGLACSGTAESAVLGYALETMPPFTGEAPLFASIFMSMCMLTALAIFLLAPRLAKPALFKGLFAVAAGAGAMALPCLLTQSLSLGGLGFFAMASTLALLMWLRAISVFPLKSTAAILIGAALAEAGLLLLVNASTPSVAQGAAFLFFSLLLLATTFKPRKLPSSETTPAFRLTESIPSLFRVLAGLLAIGFVVGCSQLATFSRGAGEPLYSSLSSFVAAALLALFLFGCRDIDAPLWLKCVLTLCLVSLLVSVGAPQLAYLSYQLTSVCFTLLTLIVYYVSIVVSRTIANPLRAFAFGVLVLTASAPLVLGMMGVGVDMTGTPFKITLLGLLGMAAIWLLNDRAVERLGQGAPASATRRASFDVAIESLAKTADLTKREREVLALYAAGRSAPYIAEKLVVSENTVKSHLQRIYRKCEVHSRQELISKLETSR